MAYGYFKGLVVILAVTTVIVSCNYYLWTKRHLFIQHFKCHKVHKVAFIKSHRVGGTSVQNVIQRFGETNKLLAAIPRTRPVLGINFHNLASIPSNLHYSLFYAHMQYFNRSMLDKILPRETFYFTIVREPFSQLSSAFYDLKYRWRTEYLGPIPKSPNPLKVYLKAPEKYDPADIKDCFTNNRMSYDLGLINNKDFTNRDAIVKWLGKLDSELDLILLMGQFSQSMILLKRKLCWELKDVLYVTKNRAFWVPEESNITSEDLDIYNKRYLADVMLYNYSVGRFQNSIAEQTPDFQEEVAVFEKILQKVTHYCHVAYTPHILLVQNLTIARTKFSPKFQITPWDCEQMMLTEIDFLRRTRKKQKDLMFIQSLMVTEKPRFPKHVQWV